MTLEPERADRDVDITDMNSLYWRILELRPKFPGAPLVMIKENWREQQPPSGPAADLFHQHLGQVKTILDVGAGDRSWEPVLASLVPAATYQTTDIDTRHRHDFSDFLAIDQSFDSVLLLELIEHLPLELGLRFVQHAVQLLNPGGVLVIGTPNPHHAHHFWSIDFTHVRPWPAHDLWSLCLVAGLKPVVYRQMLVRRRRYITMPVQRWLSKVLQLDPAYGLLVFAHKPEVCGHVRQ